MSKDRVRMQVVLVCALACAGRLAAGTYEELSQAINATAGKQMAVQNAAREREERLARALAQGTHDSAEMKATRARIEQIKGDLLEAERTLKAQFEALPELQDDIRQSKASMAEIRTLDTQRRDLLEKREAFLQKSKPKPE